MQVKKIALKDTHSFSSILLNYLNQQEDLKPFYTFPPTDDGILEATKTHPLGTSEREILRDALLQQYQEVDLTKSSRSNIESLAKANTFTITTGHQLNIFTGPLYFIYKIVSVINACKSLNQQHPDLHFVPVYWMATEDHDLEEINHFQLFGKTFTWETDQKGPVGSMLTDGLAELAQSLPEAAPLFEDAYRNAKDLAQATRIFVNELFKREGLVILDGNNANLKRMFIPIMKEELSQQQANVEVEKSSAKLEKLGYKGQVFSREINLFYMEKGMRERIVEEKGTYKVLHTELEFSQEDILALLESHPEKFSPNVILRPLYQETIMPNVAYFGGPAEVAYWLQIKSVFDLYKVAFPVVMPRNFALWINGGIAKKLNQLGIEIQDVFLNNDELKTRFLDMQGFEASDIQREEEMVRNAYEQIVKIAVEFDGSLKGFIEAEESRALKSLENIGKRLVKAAESRMEVSLRQLQNSKDRLFPNGKPQERVDNYLSIALNSPQFVETLLQHLDPFDTQFYVFIEND